MRTIIVCALVMTFIAPAPAADVDWKMYGSISATGNALCFYDAASVARLSNGHLRVWTKCLPAKELNALDPKSNLGRRIVSTAAQKIEQGYVPPVIVSARLDFTRIPLVVWAEQAADLSGILPNAQVFFELNCSKRMFRFSSTEFRVAGNETGSDEASQWKSVPPEGNAANLLKILCTPPIKK